MNATLRELDTSSLIYNDAEARTRGHVNYVDSKVSYRIVAPQLGDTDVAWEALRIDVDAACKDERFYNAVAAVRNYAFDIAARHEQMILAIDRFRSTVDAEIADL